MYRTGNADQGQKEDLSVAPCGAATIAWRRWAASVEKTATIASRRWAASVEKKNEIILFKIGMKDSVFKVRFGNKVQKKIKEKHSAMHCVESSIA